MRLFGWLRRPPVPEVWRKAEARAARLALEPDADRCPISMRTPDSISLTWSCERVRDHDGLHECSFPGITIAFSTDEAAASWRRRPHQGV